MTRNPAPPSGHPASPPRRTWGERLVVLGPPGLALVVTLPGAEADVLAPLWLAALAWTVFSSLWCALRRGLAHGDWSAFRGYRHAGDREEELDLDTRTGGYAWMRDRDERVLLDSNDRLH